MSSSTRLQSLGSRSQQRDLSLYVPSLGAKAAMPADEGLSGPLGCVTPKVLIK